MIESYYRYTIEVDPDQKKVNHTAAEDFINMAVRPIFEDQEELGFEYAYFTRLFEPERDNMGTYIRLHIFVKRGLVRKVCKRIEARIDEYPNCSFRYPREKLTWTGTAAQYGIVESDELFKQYLHFCSAMILSFLVCKDNRPEMLSRTLWNWLHFPFNMLHGYSTDIVEFAPGAIKSVKFNL